MGTEANRESDIRLEFYGGRFMATLPLLLFIVWAISLSLYKVNKTPMVNEQGLVLGIILGITVGLFFVKSPWSDYAKALFQGIAQPIGAVAIIAWFWAGMFAQLLQAGGLVEGLIWLGIQTGTQGGVFTGLTFVLAALFATAVGTGYGTVATFGLLMFPAGIILGADPVVLLGAILSGAVFGDNLAPVSDTTIVSATTQETDVPGVVRSRFKYSITAAIPALLLFVIFGGGGDVGDSVVISKITEEVGPSGLIFLVPFVLVITLALSGHHLLTSLTWGVVGSIVLILVTSVPLSKLLSIHLNAEGEPVTEGALMTGLSGYFNMAILILFILAAAYLMEAAGTMATINAFFMNLIKGVVRRAELFIYAIVALLNVFITINTAAEIAAAPFVSRLGKQLNIHPYRRANFLDTVSASLGYIFPWSGGVLLAWSTIKGVSGEYEFVNVVNPAEVFPYVFQGWGLMIVMLIAALSGWGLRYTGASGEPVKG